MIRLLKFIVIVPIAVVLLIFAFANRQIVTVSFDPFEGAPAFALQGPLFIVLIIAAAVGVIAGGVATWLSQGRHRRAARESRAEAERLRADLQAARVPVVSLRRA